MSNDETTHELLRLMLRAFTFHAKQLRDIDSKLTRIENRQETITQNIDRLNRGANHEDLR